MPQNISFPRPRDPENTEINSIRSQWFQNAYNCLSAVTGFDTLIRADLIKMRNQERKQRGTVTRNPLIDNDGSFNYVAFHGLKTNQTGRAKEAVRPLAVKYMKMFTISDVDPETGTKTPRNITKEEARQLIFTLGEKIATLIPEAAMSADSISENWDDEGRASSETIMFTYDELYDFYKSYTVPEKVLERFIPQRYRLTGEELKMVNSRLEKRGTDIGINVVLFNKIIFILETLRSLGYTSISPEAGKDTSESARELRFHVTYPDFLYEFIEIIETVGRTKADIYKVPERGYFSLKDAKSLYTKTLAYFTHKKVVSAVHKRVTDTGIIEDGESTGTLPGKPDLSLDEGLALLHELSKHHLQQAKDAGMLVE